MEPDYIRRHSRIGWWSLLLFAGSGLALELLHAFKVGWYLDVPSDTRRLMWTLAHAHGVGLSLVHVAFAATLHALPARTDQARARLASSCLSAATVCLPGGFLLGGLTSYGGDPGLGVLLVPAGAVFLLVAAGSTARLAGWRDRRPGGPS